MKTIILYNYSLDYKEYLDSHLCSWIAYNYCRRFTTQVYIRGTEDANPDLNYHDVLDIHALGLNLSADTIEKWIADGHKVTVLEKNPNPDLKDLKAKYKSLEHKLVLKEYESPCLAKSIWGYYNKLQMPSFILEIEKCLLKYEPDSDTELFYKALQQQGISYWLYNHLNMSGDRGVESLVESVRPKEVVTLIYRSQGI